MGKKYSIGIDLGGTKILTALLDKRFKLLSSEKVRVDANKGAERFFRSIKESVHEVLSAGKVRMKDVGGIGVGCPGAIQVPKGIVTLSPNISFLKNCPLKKKLSALFKVPVWIENDVNAGLYGEQQFGAAKGYEHVVGIFLGTGVGGALILDGKLYRGVLGAAGEIGHTFLSTPSALASSFRENTLEGSVGRLSIACEAAHLAMRQKAKSLYKQVGYDVKKIKSKVLLRSIRAGDKAVRDLIEDRAGLLGLSIANVVNLLNPQLIVLGGGVMEAMGHLIVPVARETMGAYAMPPLARAAKIVPAKLKDYSIVMGAAKLIHDSLRDS